MVEQNEPENNPIDVVPNEEENKVLVSRLSSLPPEILQELDTRIANGEAVATIRDQMIAKYPDVEELKVSYPTWRKRALKLRNGSLVKREIVEAVPTAEAIKTAVSTVIDPTTSLEDKKAVLEALYTKQMQRLAILESKQQNFLSPDLEALIIGYMKETRATLETVAKLQEVLQKDVLSQFRGELDEYTRVILSTVYQSYKMTHTEKDSKFDAFRGTLEDHLSKTLQAYNTHQKPL